MRVDRRHLTNKELNLNERVTFVTRYMAFEQTDLSQVGFLRIDRVLYALRVSRLMKLNSPQLQKYEDDVGGFEAGKNSIDCFRVVVSAGSKKQGSPRKQLRRHFRFRKDVRVLHGCLHRAAEKLGLNHPFVVDLNHDAAVATWASLSVEGSGLRGHENFRKEILQESRRFLIEYLSAKVEEEFQPNQFKSEELLAIIEFEIGISGAAGEWLPESFRRRVEIFGLNSRENNLEIQSCVIYLVAAMAKTSQHLEQIQEICTKGVVSAVEDDEQDRRFRGYAMAILLKIAETYHREGNSNKGEFIFEVLLDTTASHWGLYCWKTTEVRPYLAHLRMLSGRAVEAEKQIFTAWISQSITLGQLHERTLWTMLAYGGLLVSLERLEEARVLLEECFCGGLLEYGGTTRILGKAGKMLNAIYSKTRRSTIDPSHFNRKNGVIPFTFLGDDFERRPVADVVALINGFGQRYELATSVFEGILPILEAKEGRSLKVLRIKRATAIIFQMQNGSVHARQYWDAHIWEDIQRLSDSGVDIAGELVCIQCDHATILSQIPMWENEALKIARNSFFDLVKILGSEDPRTSYYHSKLDKFGLTHWMFTDSTAPFKFTRKLGQGSFGAVNEVECTAEGQDIGGRSRKTFAQKLIWIRRNRESILEIVQNEVTIIKSLRHPHIVKIHCTYEESDHFSVLFEPVADLDLEAYLDQYNSDFKDISWQWFYCLASTLAFIHENGVRHKDIKTSNILIQGEQIIFADFGSSHAFASELTSSSEGAPFGHTRMFSAPEVISESTRGRSADVFSLGCVFAEMESVACGRRPADFHKFRVKKDTGGFKRETHAYHATLDLVDTWFSSLYSALQGSEKGDPEMSPYKVFIKPMLSAAREDRPSATAVAESVRSYFGKRVLNCTYCHPQLPM